MGFGHYRISMAIASAANAMGYVPYWMDLNSYEDTTCTKVIKAQNDLYSLGSRLSQKSRLFNHFVWEPMNYEGFRKLSYNASDQKNAELMAPVYKNVPKEIPVVATHVWPAQAAVHAGKVLAAAAIDLLNQPEILKEAREEFEKRTAAGFVSPVPADAVPTIPD